ncbi:hypothetical protein NEIMUCOT_06164 [Neisseria mucosa ATCC 25996]|uniref:Uncharacterized protein n=1 Tax=Neisseria mucosa (strain ATCC 25996 / DSM 4631 / NCTC 10774 / M26) TaxID=546266 RepID=D2ZZT0_NEIM2|nr:hypothetical protein NEIMUCOT_06164 [Neisseria mucosa ATCC 25996]
MQQTRNPLRVQILLEASLIPPYCQIKITSYRKMVAFLLSDLLVFFVCSHRKYSPAVISG